MLVGSQQPAADASDDALDASVQGPNAPARQWSDAPLPLALDRLPPLPEIRNEALARQALTHKRNLHNEVKSPYAAEVGSYRQLEWLGDEVLGSALARVLIERFPDASPANFNTLHDKLAKNFTWSHIAQAYGIPSRVVEAVRPEQRPALEVIVRQQYVVADLFEAHFGALSKESGDSPAYDWVKAAVEAGVFPTLDAHARTEIDDLMARRSASHVRRTRSYEMEQDLPRVAEPSTARSVFGRRRSGTNGSSTTTMTPGFMSSSSPKERRSRAAEVGRTTTLARMPSSVSWLATSSS